MAQNKFNCSICGQRLECDDQHAGREIECPKCHGRIVIPTTAAGTAQASPNKSGMTFVPESWKKPDTTPPPKAQTGQTHVPETWKKPPPAASE